VIEALLETRDLCKRFGGIAATADVSLAIAEGTLHAVIGPNGAGKTTLIAQLSGEMPPDSGSIWLDATNITALAAPARARRGLARSFQITSLCREFTALDNVALAVQARQGHSFRFWRPARTDARLTRPAMELLGEVGLADRAEMPAGHLAHGEQRQLELAVALATGPRILLLDEPMAGMGQGESARLIRLIRELKARYTILLVEHDMEAVFSLADVITVLVNGRVIASGAPAEIRASTDVQAAYLGSETA
jgi:branched-chain amino acid transport system ATP-binding protein